MQCSFNRILTVSIDHNTSVASLKTWSSFPLMMFMFLFFLLPPPSPTVPSMQAVFPVVPMVWVCNTLTLRQVSNNESRGSD